MAYELRLVPRTSTLGERAELSRAVASALISSPSPDGQVLALLRVMDEKVVPRQLAYTGSKHLEDVEVEGLVLIFEAARAVIETHVLTTSRVNYFRSKVSFGETLSDQYGLASLIIRLEQNQTVDPDERARFIQINYPGFLYTLENYARCGLLSSLREEQMRKMAPWMENMSSCPA